MYGHRCSKQATPLVPGRSTDGAPLQQEWGTAEVSKGLLPKSLQQLAGAGVRAKPTTCLLKEGLNYAVPPPTSSLLSLTSSPWGNHHLYMRFSLFFFNLFSAPCHRDPRGLATRLGLPASLKAGCFTTPPMGTCPRTTLVNASGASQPICTT